MLNPIVAGAIVLAAAGFYALGYLVAYSRHLTDLMERRALRGRPLPHHHHHHHTPHGGEQ